MKLINMPALAVIMLSRVSIISISVSMSIATSAYASAQLNDPTRPNFMAGSDNTDRNSDSKSKKIQFNLQAVTFSFDRLATQNSAVINNKIVKIGDALSTEATLIEIHPNHVVLARDGKQQKIMLNAAQVKSASDSKLSVNNDAK